MADSIKERILQDWITTLQTISQGNGYETTPDKIERFHLLGMDKIGNLLIETKMGSDSSREDSFGEEERTLRIHTTISLRHDSQDDGLSSDQLMNAVIQDVYRAALLDPFRGGLARDTRYTGTEELLVEEGAALGEVDVIFEVDYRHRLGDMTVI